MVNEHLHSKLRSIKREQESLSIESRRTVGKALTFPKVNERGSMVTRKDNKGSIRIAELLISITILTIVVIIFYKQTVPSQETQDLGELARDILADVSARDPLRAEIVRSQNNTQNMVNTKTFIDSGVPDYISFELRSCDISSACGASTYHGDVYSAERTISTNGSAFNPIKLRLFLWVEE